MTTRAMRNLNLRAVAWRLKTHWQKKIIEMEDRWGLFSYARWIQENEPVPAEFLAESGRAAQMEPRPLFSLLLPIAIAEGELLARTTRSLQEQTYLEWELCLVGEAPPAVDNELARFIPSGSGVTHAHGDFVMFLHPGDTLSPNTLFVVASRVNADPQADIVYFDEDQLSVDGKNRHTPFLKPDWSPELLLSVNYLASAFFRRKLLLDCEENFLRCVEDARQIVHIPQVLYHAARQDAAPLKQRVLPSDLTAHLQRCGVVNARVEESSIETPRFTWPTTNRLVSIIIPSKDHVEYLQRCLESIWRVTQYPNYEIVIVDNDSQERRTLDYYTCLRQTPGVTVVECRDAFNYSAYNNRGAHQGRGDILLFLNNDVEVLDPDWLDELERWVERPEVGIVGAKLLYPDGIIQHAGIVLGMEGHASHVFGGLRDGCTGPFGSVNWYRDVLAVTGACMMVRREVFEALGGFDEQYVLVFGDIEICLRAVARGYRVVYTPFARLIHYEGKSRAHYIPATDIRLAYRHMKTWVERGDPYYNPNLSHAVRFPTLRRREEAPLERLRKIVEYS